MAFVPKVVDGRNARSGNGLPDLAARAAAGDLEATSAFLRELAPRIVRLVRSLVGPDNAEADDIVQQALIAVSQAMAAFRGDCGPWHYASRIVTRVALAAARRARAHGIRHDGSVDFDALPGEAASQDPDGEKRRSVIRGLLADLPGEQAETFALRVVLGYTLGEVADATGAPINTVRSRIRLAKEALRRCIEANPRLQELLEIEE